MTGVTLWIPCGTVRPESWLQVEAYMNTRLPDGYSMTFKRSPRGNVEEIWNKVVCDFLAGKDEWLWSVHDDIVYHPDTLPRLLSWYQPIVSALVFMRQNPAYPFIYQWNGERYIQDVDGTRDWFKAHERNILPGAQVIDPRPDDALVEADFTSTACCLFHRSVFEDLRETMGEQWFTVDDKVWNGGEDRTLYQMAQNIGYQTFIDRSCIAGHLFGAQPTGAMDFMLWAEHPIFTG